MKAIAYISSENLRHEKREMEWKQDLHMEMQLVKTYPDVLKQEIYGFGGAFTEAAAATCAEMDEEMKKQFFSLYFGEEGNRYRFCRTHIQSCDFALGNYAYIEDENDRELSGFSLERDEKYLLPMLQEAQKYEKDICLLASPWSPPAFMKTNGEMNHGGSLKKEYYPMWADMMARYCEEYEKRGVHIAYLSVQNEPLATQSWDSCIYTGEEEGIFAADYLKPALEKRGLGEVKILCWDHNKDCILERVQETFEVKGAREAAAGVAFHWYSGDHFEELAEIREQYPEKELIFTEGCVEYSRFKKNDQVKNAEMYLHDMLGNLNAGMNAYIDWNLLLNEEGGPNHVGNFCDAPVMYNRKNKSLDVKLSYYYIGHLSRYVQPGARRMLVSRYTDQVETAGFVNPDGSRVIVIMNRNENPVNMGVSSPEGVCPVRVEPHTVMTLCWEKA